MSVMTVISAILKPVTGLLQKKQERKMARESARSALEQARVSGAHEINLNDQQLESVLANVRKDSWLDEYVTVSFVSIVNMVVLGGLLSAFGHNQVLEGMATTVATLTEMGLDVGFLLDAVVLSAVGLVVWRKI